MQRLRRPPRLVSPMFGRRRPHRDDPVPPGKSLVHMASPADDFTEAIQRAATLLRDGRQYDVVGTMPTPVRDSYVEKHGTSVTEDEADKLGIEAWAIAETRKDDRRRMLFKVAATVDDFEAVGIFAETLSLMPKVLRALLAIVRPWHLALLGVEGFEDCGKPEPEALRQLTESVTAQLGRWGVKIDVESNHRKDA